MRYRVGVVAVALTMAGTFMVTAPSARALGENNGRAPSTGADLDGRAPSGTPVIEASQPRWPGTSESSRRLGWAEAQALATG